MTSERYARSISAMFSFVFQLGVFNLFYVPFTFACDRIVKFNVMSNMFTKLQHGELRIIYDMLRQFPKLNIFN